MLEMGEKTEADKSQKTGSKGESLFPYGYRIRVACHLYTVIKNVIAVIPKIVPF